MLKNTKIKLLVLPVARSNQSNGIKCTFPAVRSSREEGRMNFEKSPYVGFRNSVKTR